MQEPKYTTTNIAKDWYINSYKTCTPFKNNNNYGSELSSNANVTSLVKDWNKQTFNTTNFNNRSLHGYETKENKSINLSKKKINNFGKILRNKNKFGYEMKNELPNLSIAKPRYWPSRGLNETV